MEKLSKIPWGIINDKEIKYKFEHQSGMAQMAEQKIVIYLQNVMSCLKFLMIHPSFCHNQKYKLFSIYNKNEQQVYNKMYTSEWW